MKYPTRRYASQVEDVRVKELVEVATWSGNASVRGSLLTGTC
jgi:hypothetical protein